MCQAKTEILWVWKFFTSSTIHVRQNKHYNKCKCYRISRQLGVTAVSLFWLCSPDTCPAWIRGKGRETLELMRVWVWNGLLPCIRGCLTCKAGLGASELVFERRPSLGGERQNSYHATACRAAALVTHSYELVIRNVSSHEEVSGSGLLDCISCLLMLFIWDRWLLHAQ